MLSHSAGFSADSLASRINDCKSKLVFTCNENIRGSRTIPLKATVDEALKDCPSVEKVFVLQHTAAESRLKAGKFRALIVNYLRKVDS